MEKPPFEISAKVLDLCLKIQEILTEVKIQSLAHAPLKLRKTSKIQTVHHSLAIEGNSLSEEKITAILENKRVIGPKSQIQEVANALELYEKIGQLNPLQEKQLLKAHTLLMRSLIAQPGRYRAGAVGILKGSKVSHVAPPAKQVPLLMRNLFAFLNGEKKISWLVKACVFHYELEFIHPFQDGNGRIGRLWQQLILMKASPIFEFVSVETLIHKRQSQYYEILEICDKRGESTAFIEFSLGLVLQSLKAFSEVYRPSKPGPEDRIAEALQAFGAAPFSRKDYLQLHKTLSTATASRDLALAVKKGLLRKTGDKSRAVYLRGSRE